MRERIYRITERIKKYKFGIGNPSRCVYNSGSEISHGFKKIMSKKPRESFQKQWNNWNSWMRKCLREKGSISDTVWNTQKTMKLFVVFVLLSLTLAYNDASMSILDNWVISVWRIRYAWRHVYSFCMYQWGGGNVFKSPYRLYACLLYVYELFIVCIMI